MQRTYEFLNELYNSPFGEATLVESCEQVAQAVTSVDEQIGENAIIVKDDKEAVRLIPAIPSARQFRSAKGLILMGSYGCGELD